MVFASLACAGCALMPASGPQSFEVTGISQGEPVSLPFALVKLEPQGTQDSRPGKAATFDRLCEQDAAKGVSLRHW